MAAVWFGSTALCFRRLERSFGLSELPLNSGVCIKFTYRWLLVSSNKGIRFSRHALLGGIWDRARPFQMGCHSECAIRLGVYIQFPPQVTQGPAQLCMSCLTVLQTPCCIGRGGPRVCSRGRVDWLLCISHACLHPCNVSGALSVHTGSCVCLSRSLCLFLLGQRPSCACNVSVLSFTKLRDD